MRMRIVETVTKHELQQAIKAATSYAGVLKNLGTYSDGPNHRLLKERLNEFGIDPDWKGQREQRLRKAVAAATTMKETLQLLGLSLSPTNFTRYKRSVERLELDTSHWGYGRGMQRYREKRGSPRPLAYYLVEGSNIASSSLRKRLIREEVLPAQCAFEDCPTREMTTWRGGQISLELDHINGISDDNRIGNLRILCRMCHALTPTHSRKKKPPREA
jgi:hypothetical protein